MSYLNVRNVLVQEGGTVIHIASGRTEINNVAVCEDSTAISVARNETVIHNVIVPKGETHIRYGNNWLKSRDNHAWGMIENQKFLVPISSYDRLFTIFDAMKDELEAVDIPVKLNAFIKKDVERNNKWKELEDIKDDINDDEKSVTKTDWKAHKDSLDAHFAKQKEESDAYWANFEAEMKKDSEKLREECLIKTDSESGCIEEPVISNKDERPYPLAVLDIGGSLPTSSKIVGGSEHCTSGDYSFFDGFKMFTKECGKNDKKDEKDEKKSENIEKYTKCGTKMVIGRFGGGQIIAPIIVVKRLQKLNHFKKILDQNKNEEVIEEMRKETHSVFLEVLIKIQSLNKEKNYGIDNFNKILDKLNKTLALLRQHRK